MRRTTSRTRKQTVDSGIGNNARSQWSGDRVTPNQQQQLMGMYVGQVMDDQDDQRRGRVWVYIPQISPRRFDDQSLPTYGGTTPDRTTASGLSYDQKLRNGWFLISPVSPFSGSDDFRNQAAPDGRNSASGDVNSYGMWSQPRIGDFVAVMFDGGDANSGYWLGMVSQPGRGGMVPGIPGTAASDISDRETNELVPQVQPEAQLPAMDRTPNREDPATNDQTVATDLARNIARAGTSGDMARGAGSSGSNRESPSYVTGLKSAGWSYDSERLNRNTDGQTQFEQQIDAYYDRNSVGHQMVMDDHPDHQSMRLRTSDGAQILMQDSCGTPYIYIQTQTGNAWIELADSGDINIYGAGGLNIHSEGDYNLTVDGDMNVGVRGNYNVRVNGNNALGVQGSNTVSIGNDMVMGVEGQYDFQAGDDARVTYNGEFDQRVGGGYNLTITDGMDIISGSGIRQQAGGDMTFQVNGNTVINTTGNYGHIIDGSSDITVAGSAFYTVEGDTHTTAGGTMFNSASGSINFQGGGSFHADASNINLNSGTSSAATAAEPQITAEFFAASTAAVPILPPLNQTAGPPSESDILGNNTPSGQESVASVVPQHQPWGQRCGFGSTPGTNGLVSSAPQDGGIFTTSDNITCTRTDRDANIRQGAQQSTSMVPNTILGGIAEIAGQIPLAFAGQGFRTDSSAETPVYRAVRMADERETHTPDSLSLSVEGINFIRGQETFIPRPTLDPLKGGYVVGYGHRISYGDSINGSFLDSDVLRNIGNFANDQEKALRITQEEAEAYLNQELDEIQQFVTTQFADVEMSQQQYDTLISFIRNVGIETIQREEPGQAFLQAVNSGNFEQVQQNMLQFSYVGGAVDCNVLDRRRGEVGRMGQPSDRDGITGQAIGYVPVGETVSIGGFTITAEVFNAICNAGNNIAPQLPAGYLLTICAQESGFNPNAKAGTSSAAGLFQFIRDTGQRYGLSRDRSPASNVFDPVANANAGAQFNLDNYNILTSVGITNPNATDLYMAHFLGAGDGRARNGAARFLTQPGSAIPAVDNAFRAAANSNRSIFYRNGNTSEPRTYDEVYVVMERKIGKRLPLFQSACSSSPPVMPAGDFQWVRGSREPNFYRVDPRIRAIAERSAIEAGITQLGFNSGFRDAATNERVGGATNSQHLFGLALDINVGTLGAAQQRAFCEALARNGVTGFGVGTNTFHIDIRNAGRVTWEYRGGNGRVRDILQRFGYRGA